jgi:hypothetical protein
LHEQVRHRVGAISTVGQAAQYLDEVRGRLSERGVRNARTGDGR